MGRKVTNGNDSGRRPKALLVGIIVGVFGISIFPSSTLAGLIYICRGTVARAMGFAYEAADEDFVTRFLGCWGYISLVAGPLGTVASVGLFLRKNWARRLMIGLLSLTILAVPVFIVGFITTGGSSQDSSDPALIMDAVFFGTGAVLFVMVPMLVAVYFLATTRFPVEPAPGRLAGSGGRF